ncbi:MAG: hypothetical protein ABIO49_11955 [Dokdonella sp.]
MFGATNRAIRMLFAAFISLGCNFASPADVSLGVTFSPEAALAIRDWRRAHGLPQPPESVEVAMPVNRSNAIQKAIHYAGLKGAPADHLLVEASHISSHWHVTIHVRDTPSEKDCIIDVSDALANSNVTAESALDG